MLKLTEAADLEKGGKAIGDYFAKQAAEFEKSHSFHKSMSSHHESLHKAHSAHAADCADCSKAMENDHELKGHMTKAAGAHEQMAACNKAMADEHAGHADHFKTQIDAMKALANQFGGGTTAAANKTTAAGTSVEDLAKGEGLDARLSAVTELMMTKAVESLNTNPTVGEAIERIVLDQIEKRIGGKLQPTQISSIAPPAGDGKPQPLIRSVGRPGQPTIEEKTSNLEFSKVFGDD